MKHDYQAVRVIEFSEPPGQDFLEFRLIFPDGCEKMYTLDSYAIKQFRGMGIRDIIEEQARQYLEDVGELGPGEAIKLVFL